MSVVLVRGLSAVVSVALLISGCNGAADKSDAQCPSGIEFCDCAYADGSYYNCGVDGGIPACPANAEPGTACDPVGASCLSCPEGAGLLSYCTDPGAAADAGPQWIGVGTGHVCKGP
jgi:hypothetical protein